MTKIAINVALFPPADIANLVISINKQLRERQPSSLVIGSTTRFAHITLLQAVIDTHDINKAQELIRHLAHKSGPIYLQGRFGCNKKLNISFLEIERTPELQALHEEIMTQFSPMISDDVQKAYFADNIVQPWSIEWVRNFPKLSANDKYNPHITLGDGDVLGLAPEKLVSFKTNRLALCHLGKRGTCKEILYEVSLVLEKY